MSQVDRTVNRQRVSQYREKVRAAGRIFVNTDLPKDLVDCLVRIKAERGIASRAQVFEEALRAYVENELRA